MVLDRKFNLKPEDAVKCDQIPVTWWNNSTMVWWNNSTMVCWNVERQSTFVYVFCYHNKDQNKFLVEKADIIYFPSYCLIFLHELIKTGLYKGVIILNLPLDHNQNDFKKNKQILFQANLPIVWERNTEKLNITEKAVDTIMQISLLLTDRQIL